jgi:HPt (histidine-containing phosphotransfer) domain-containing protein
VSDEPEEQTEKNFEEIIISDEIKEDIDVNTGLRYVGNSRETYFSILKTYVKKGTEKLELLKELYEQEDWKNYVIEVHALKSSSLSIGAKELSEQAKRLELNGKAGDYGFIKQNHDSMYRLYTKVLDLGEKLLADNEQKEKTEPEPVQNVQQKTLEEMKDILTRMKQACDSFDMDEIIAAAKEELNGSYNGKTLSSWFNKAIEAAEDFDYDAVTSVMEDMRNACGLEEE